MKDSQDLQRYHGIAKVTKATGDFFLREKMTSEIPDEKLHAIQSACQLIDAGDIEGAKSEINAKYPFVPFSKAGRVYTPRVMTKIFVRDGFIDRYRGNRLVLSTRPSPSVSLSS